MITDGGFVLASLNLHGGRDRHGAPFDIAAACRSLEADVIIMQEAWRPEGQPDPVGAVARALGYQVIHADLLAATTLARLAIASDTAGGRWGLALLTLLPVTDQVVIDLGKAARDVCHRAALVVTVALRGGGELRIAGTHLTHRFPSSLGQLRLLRARLAGSRAPTVIAGDLNMPGPGTWVAAGYARAVRGPTFPAHQPVVELDHMLTGRGVVALGGEVLPDVGSDHLPIRAHLHLGLPGAQSAPPASTDADGRHPPARQPSRIRSPAAHVPDIARRIAPG